MTDAVPAPDAEPVVLDLSTALEGVAPVGPGPVPSVPDPSLIPIMKVPTTVVLQQRPDGRGRFEVVFSVSTPSGTTRVVMDPEPAIDIGKELTRYGNLSRMGFEVP